MKATWSATSLLGVSILAFSTSVAIASETSYTFYSYGDNFVKGYSNNNENEGLNANLKIQHGDRFSNVLVHFSESEILTTIGQQHVKSAKLELFLETNYGNWGSGAWLDAHRMIVEWTETGSTWNCASDTNLENNDPDCDDLWAGGYYEPFISDSLFHQNGETGWKSYDVTGDVQLFQGGVSDFGWLIRKRNYSDSGSLDYTSIQGNATRKPRLVVVVDDLTCTPTVVDTVSPGWIQSNGSPHTITVTGTGMNNVFEVLRDGAPLSFTIVDSSTLTFTDSATTEEVHQIQLTSNCLASPVDLYEIEAFDAGHLPVTVTCRAPGAVTRVSRGHDSSDTSTDKYLCYRRNAVKLIGYGPPAIITDDERYCNNGSTAPTCSIDGVNCSSCPSWCSSCTSTSDTRIPDFLENARYFSQSSGGHGSNLMRIWVHGYSGHFDKNGHDETMPFRKNANGKWLINTTSATTGPALNPRYENRLDHVLTEALNRGQVVQLSLFEHLAWRDPDEWNDWNPWNRHGGDRNDLPSNCIDFGQDAAPKEFYKLCNAGYSGLGSSACPDNQLSCIGKAQKNLVRRIMTVVKTRKNGGSFKNVFIEVANESQLQADTDADFKHYKTWHKTVSSWVRSFGAYLVSANPLPERYSNDHKHKYMFDCSSPSTCTNQFAVFNDANIQIMSIHGNGWTDYPAIDNILPCSAAKDAVAIYKRPVIIDDDGFYPERDDNADIYTWAQEATRANCIASNGASGVVHYNHLEDGLDMPATVPDCDPTDVGETYYVDCAAYNSLGNISPWSDLCALATCPAMNETDQYCIVKGCYNQ